MTQNVWGSPDSPSRVERFSKIANNIREQAEELDLDALCLQEVLFYESDVELFEKVLGKRKEGLGYYCCYETDIPPLGLSFLGNLTRQMPLFGSPKKPFLGGGLLTFTKQKPLEASFQMYKKQGGFDPELKFLERIKKTIKQLPDAFLGKGFQLIKLGTEENPISLFNTHLICSYTSKLFGPNVKAQTEELADLVQEEIKKQRRVFVAGDFNFPFHETENKLYWHLRNLSPIENKIPEHLKKNHFGRQVDFILSSTGRIRTSSSELEAYVYDHGRMKLTNPTEKETVYAADLIVQDKRYPFSFNPEDNTLKFTYWGDQKNHELVMDKGNDHYTARFRNEGKIYFIIINMTETPQLIFEGGKEEHLEAVLKPYVLFTDHPGVISVMEYD